MNTAEKMSYTQQAQSSNGNSVVIIVSPRSYQDVKAEIVRMENRHVILFNIEKMPDSELTRSLDYLAGFTDCCGGTISKMSSNLVLVAPSSVTVSQDSYGMRF